MRYPINDRCISLLQQQAADCFCHLQGHWQSAIDWPVNGRGVRSECAESPRVDTQGATGIYCAVRTSCTQASASFTSKSRVDLEVRIKEGQWPQELA